MSTSLSTLSTRRRSPSVGAAAVVMLALLAALWAIEAFDQVSGNALDLYGIHARDLDGVPLIFTAPFLHGGWPHLISNSLPFLVLGFLVLLGGLARWLIASVISIVTSGLAAWFLTPVNSIVLGASGLIFGWLTYLIARGLWSRQPSQVVVGLLVLVAYGGLIWGVLPGVAGVSWQAHLGGAIGGVVAARMLHARSQSRPGVR